MPKAFAMEDWLNVLLFWSEKILLPTFRNLDKSFEMWEWENRTYLQVRRLQQRCLIQREEPGAQSVLLLTQQGRLVALGGRDPVEHWNQPWDNKWRSVSFDFPVSKQSLRKQLLRMLKNYNFGYFHHSVWIHPHPIPDKILAMKKLVERPGVFIAMESTCYPGFSDSEVVEDSWDFVEINRRYRAYLDFVNSHSDPITLESKHGSELAVWLQRERQSWLYAVCIDPLLPKVLHPPDYLGMIVWETRQKSMIPVIQALQRKVVQKS